MTNDEIRVLSDVSKYDKKTRQALATAIEVAYAAAKRGILPNEAMTNPTDYKKGDRVLYTGGAKPETGTVTSCNSTFVFVDFTGTGIGVACDVKDLQKA